MLVHAVETYLRRNIEKLKDKLTSLHSKFGIKSNNIARCGWYVAGKLTSWNELPAILLAILLGVDAP